MGALGRAIRQRLHKEIMMDRICKQSGSTLIEILVSMVVMAITLLGGIALYFNASELQKMAMHKKMATELANSRMEELRTMSCADIEALNHSWADLQVGGLLLAGADSKGIKVLDPPPIVPPDTHCKVEVQIKWNEVGQINRDFNINLATFVAP